MAKSLRDIAKKVTPDIEQSAAMPPEKAKEKEFIDMHKIDVHGELPWDKLGVEGQAKLGPDAGKKEEMKSVKESIEVDLADLTEDQLEVLDEVSKGLVKRYRAKASDDMYHGRPDGGALRPWNHADSTEEGERFRKRNAGMGLADKKLGRHYTADDRKNPAKVKATESVEIDLEGLTEDQLDELFGKGSVAKIRTYHEKKYDKANKKAVAADNRGDLGKLGKHASEAGKHGNAADRARRLERKVSEEVEVLDELDRKTLKSYERKATTSRDRHEKKGEAEEDKAMSTDGNKYPDKQNRHNANATAHYKKSEQRNRGLTMVKKRLGK